MLFNNESILDIAAAKIPAMMIPIIPIGICSIIKVIIISLDVANSFPP